MSSLEDILDAILYKITTLRSEIIISLQQKSPQETAKYVNERFDLLYYDIYEFKTQFNLLAYNEGKDEQLQKIQKAESVIQLQTLSAKISAKIDKLFRKNENTDF